MFFLFLFFSTTNNEEDDVIKATNYNMKKVLNGKISYNLQKDLKKHFNKATLASLL